MSTTSVAAPQVDPRFRARRIAVQRAEGRRRMRRLVLLSGVVAALAAGVALTRSPLLDVDRVVIEGLRRTAQTTASEAVAVSLGTALADVDPGAVEARVEALPWVADAHVERTLPGTLRVVVRERVPVAAVEDGAGDVVLVDATGRVLAAAAAVPSDLVMVEGRDEDVGAPGTQVSAALTEAVRLADVSASLDGVDAVVLADDGLSVRTDGGGRILVGEGRQLADKVLAAAAVLAERELGAGTLDVRVPTSPVLTGTAEQDIPSTNTRG